MIRIASHVAAATLALAAILVSALTPASAQTPETSAPTKPAPGHHRPREPAANPSAAPNGTPAQSPGAATARGNAAELDMAYGAFQRGYFLTAFALATHRVEDKGDVKAMTLLGELYSGGLGVPQNDAKAAEWYKLAADRGDRDAMFALAMFALQGRAGPRDRDASAKWLAAAAKLGHPLAAYDLALLYIEGQLFPQDFKRAAELLHVAAAAGNPEAQYALGTFYKEGRGVPWTSLKRCGCGGSPRSPKIPTPKSSTRSRCSTAAVSPRTRPGPRRCSARPRSRATPSRRIGWRAFSPTAAARRKIRSRRPSGT